MLAGARIPRVGEASCVGWSRVGYDAGGRPHPKAVDGRLSGASRCSTRPPREGSGPRPVVARQAGPRRRRPPGSSFVSSNGSRVSPAGTAGPEEACGWTSPAGESRRGQVRGRRGRRCARRVSDPGCARGRRVRAGCRAGSATPLGVVRVPAAEALCAAPSPGTRPSRVRRVPDRSRAPRATGPERRGRGRSRRLRPRI